jgi:hypothetical protein
MVALKERIKDQAGIYFPIVLSEWRSLTRSHALRGNESNREAILGLILRDGRSCGTLDDRTCPHHVFGNKAMDRGDFSIVSMGCDEPTRFPNVRFPGNWVRLSQEVEGHDGAGLAGSCPRRFPGKLGSFFPGRVGDEAGLGSFRPGVVARIRPSRGSSLGSFLPTPGGPRASPLAGRTNRKLDRKPPFSPNFFAYPGLEAFPVSGNLADGHSDCECQQ